jgi:hypothetical protein
MFMFSSNELPPRAAFLLRNLDVKDFCWLCDLPEVPLIRPSVANSAAGEVDKARKHYLLIELVPPNARRTGSSVAPVLADGAEGLPMTDSIVLPVRTGPVSPCA